MELQEILKIADAEELQTALLEFGIHNLLLNVAPEPYKTKAIEALDPSVTYMVFNPGKAFNVGFKKKKVKINSGATEHPLPVALFLLNKYGKGSDKIYGVTENSCLLDHDPAEPKASRDMKIGEFTQAIEELSYEESLELVSPGDERSGILGALENKKAETKVGA